MDMNNINSKDLHTNRLDLRLPSMGEQHRLWEILCLEEVNNLYFPTPDRIFRKYELSKDNINDLKEARKIFLTQLNDWERQEPFYKAKVESVKNQEDSSKFTWSIFLKDTDIVIGQVTCQEKDDESLDIRDVGWFIDPKYQGKGYASEAAEAMLNFMFNEVDIKEIRTSAAGINPASWKIMERLGFKYDGTYKSTYFVGNNIIECKKYYIDKDMYLKR
jgi:RimJ/RimL family protein N-acetyltransferase